MSALQPILVVDDFHTMCRIVAGMLRRQGFADVVAVHSGADALQEMRRKVYAAVICDLEMEPMNGVQFIQLLRADPVLAAIPVVVMTAYKHRLLELERSASADACMLKPFSPELLTEKLTAVLGKER